MTFQTRLRASCLASVIVAAVTFAGAQQPAVTTTVQNAPLGQTVPVDPLITVGALPNGLRYYIRANKLPKSKVECLSATGKPGSCA